MIVFSNYSQATKENFCKTPESALLKESCFKEADLSFNYLNTANKKPTGVCGFFLSVKFATSLTRFARRGIIF